LWNCSRWNDSRNLAERLKRLIPWFLFSSWAEKIRTVKSGFLVSVD
jgi:hypothetical protein